MLSIFQRKEKRKKTGDLASENPDTECEIGEVHSCFYLLKHFPKYSLFLLGLVFVFAAYNMNSTFLIDWIEGMGGNHADYGMAQFVLAMAEIPVALVFYRIRGRVSIDKLMVVCAFFLLPPRHGNDIFRQRNTCHFVAGTGTVRTQYLLCRHGVFCHGLSATGGCRKRCFPH